MKKTIILTFFAIFLLRVQSVNAQTATNEANSVLQKVKEKVEALKRNPKAFIGPITDKTDTSIQIRGVNGNIELVSITDTTKFNKINGKDEEIEFSDIAIGDYVSALGTFENTQVLSARRVLLSDQPDTSKKITYGRVSSIVKRDITINGEGGNEIILVFPSKWKGPEIKDINEGDLVVAVSTEIKDKQTIRTIEIVSSENSDI